jgi:hypothetical protein
MAYDPLDCRSAVRRGDHVHTDDAPVGDLDRLTGQLDHALERLASAPAFARPTKVRPVLDAAKRILLQDGGPAAIEARAVALETAGVFEGTDWAQPELLNPLLSRQSLGSTAGDTVVVESLSNLRLVAVAVGDLALPAMTPDEARQHLTQVLAHNLGLLFGAVSEADRVRQGRLAQIAQSVLRHVADRVGYERLLGELVDEIWRILAQRPIQVDHVKRMITQIAIYREDPDIDMVGGGGADRLITAVYGPTRLSREDPGVEVYRERLLVRDRARLQSEATGFARAMHDTGLVSPYHAVLVDVVRQQDDQLLADALGLTSAARDTLLRHRDLVHALLDAAIRPETAQALYGLALLLERGILHYPPMAPSLWRHLHLDLSPVASDRLRTAYGDAHPPRVWLLAGVLSMLGLPLGVGQGDNPTCQSARALSMWASNDPDFLLHVVARAARDDEIVMHFEGQRISSRELPSGVATTLPTDLDPVSLLTVPHLDRIYAEMGRRCVDRPGDPHRWVNPEFHGWWAWRGFRIAVDVTTGQLVELDGFLRDLYATYHPAYNGDQPLTHPQPAGLAVTDTAGRFVGWHAITLLRVAPDPAGVMRMYFFNPNDDGGQDWGDGVLVSTADHGERYGESSLPFPHLASRLYIFHHDPLEVGHPELVPADEIQEVTAMVHRTWGADRRSTVDLQAHPGPGSLGT